MCPRWKCHNYVTRIEIIEHGLIVTFDIAIGFSHFTKRENLAKLSLIFRLELCHVAWGYFM